MGEPLGPQSTQAEHSRALDLWRIATEPLNPYAAKRQCMKPLVNTGLPTVCMSPPPLQISAPLSPPPNPYFGPDLIARILKNADAPVDIIILG